MVGDHTCFAIHVIDADAVAVTIRADQAHRKIISRNPPYSRPIWSNHAYWMSVRAVVIGRHK